MMGLCPYIIASLVTERIVALLGRQQCALQFFEEWESLIFTSLHEFAKFGYHFCVVLLFGL